MLVVLFGQIRYAVAQGERAAFLSRFLSPQVTELVRVDGLATVTRAREIEVTVVACDLRGFTSYAEAVPSQAVIDLLTEYYDAVFEAVAAVDGTVKDCVGDGILILVGAPLPRGGPRRGRARPGSGSWRRRCRCWTASGRSDLQPHESVLAKGLTGARDVYLLSR